jgi:heptaprenylglyceryl phosphate synthase
MIYQKIVEARGKEKLFALLLDPDRCDFHHIGRVLTASTQIKISMLLVGGSLVNTNINSFVTEIKKLSQLPVLLFPGSAFQFTPETDAILLLSLISGGMLNF